MKASQQIDFGSDLHIDFYHTDINWESRKNPESDTLILAGDTSNNVDLTCKFLKNARKHYKHVCYVPGNHDFYQSQRGYSRWESVSTVSTRLFNNSMLDDWTYLPARDLVLGTTVIIGENGWYGFCGDGFTYEEQKSAWNRYMADSRLIEFDESLPDVLALKDASTLTEKIKKYDVNPDIDTIIVVTHTLPIKEALITKPGNIAWNQLSGSFWNHNMQDLNFLSKKVSTWIFGHTHSSWDIAKDYTRFVANPRGYPEEIQFVGGWKPKTIEV